MSTLELPASIALIIVMAILALCLAADARAHPPSRSMTCPAVAATANIIHREISNSATARSRPGAAEARRLARFC
jgi:hypothetical protein